MWEWLKDKADEIGDDIKGRFKNPLILSFILVWLYKHWVLVYYILTVKGTDVLTRAEYISSYISERELSGMVGWPLFWAFISLLGYYGIGIIAQAIKILVGKRLYAHLIVKLDSGRFDTKEETDRLRKDKAKLRKEIRDTLSENDQLREMLNLAEEEKAKKVDTMSALLTEKDSLITSLTNDVQKLSAYEKNFKEGRDFFDSIQKPLLILLFKAQGAIVALYNKHDSIHDARSVLGGKWEVKFFTIPNKDNFTPASYEISGDEIHDYQTKRFIGKINNFNYDPTTHFIGFSFTEAKDGSILTGSVLLVKVTDSQFIGVWNEQGVEFIKPHSIPVL